MLTKGVRLFQATALMSSMARIKLSDHTLSDSQTGGALGQD